MRKKQSFGKKTFCNDKSKRNTTFPTKTVRQFVESYGILWKCERCGSTLETDLQVYHKDGNRANNKKENLQILCFNCHKIIHGKKIRLKEPKVAINITVPQTLLAKIEENVHANNRSQKIVICAQAGYPIVCNTEDAIQT